MSDEDKLRKINQLLADYNLRLSSIRRIAGDPVSTFLDLSDSPAAYIGHGTKVISVKATEDGLEFTVSAAGGGASWCYADGQWYSMEIVCNNNLGSLFWIGANYLWAFPMHVGQTQSFDQIAACVYGGQAAGREFRLGIYKSNPATGYPGDLVCDSGVLSAASTSWKQAAITAALDAELHYLAILGSHNIQFRATRRAYVGTFLGRATPSNVYHGTCWRVIQAYGALPDPFPGGAVIRVEGYPVGILIRAV